MKLRAVIGDRRSVVLPPDILGDEIHRSRTVQRDPGDDILQAVRLQLLHKALHARALQLEYAVRLPGADIIHHFLVIIIDLLHVQIRLPAPCKIHRVPDHRQRPKPQEIHLQKPKFFQRRHRKLGRDRAVGRPRQRDIFIHGFLADDHARRVHGAVAWQAFQPLAHVDQRFHLLIGLVDTAQFRILFQRLVDRYIQFLGDHLGDGIHKCIGQVHHAPHIAQHAPGRKRTESHDLNHPVLPVLAHHVIDHFLPPLVAEIHVDIRHGHTLRVQEALKEQLIPDRINGRDLQAVGHDAPGCRSTPRADRDPVVFRIFYKIPYDQEIIHISHVPDRIQLIVQTVLQLLRRLPVPALQSLPAEFLQIFPGRIPVRHIIFRQLRHTEFDLHGTPVRDPLRIVQRLKCIGKKLLHLLRRFHIILSALIAHPVLIGQLLAGLDAEQDVMGDRILRVGIVDIVGRHKFDPGLLGHLQQLLVDQPLIRQTVILQLQKIIVLPENVAVFQRRLLRLIIKSLYDITLDFPCKTGA